MKVSSQAQSLGQHPLSQLPAWLLSHLVGRGNKLLLLFGGCDDWDLAEGFIDVFVLLKQEANSS